MTESAARESLPAAVASVFDAVAASSAAGAGSAQSGIRTPEDWATLLSALSTAGLLPQTELLSASRDLALPATYAQLHRLDSRVIRPMFAALPSTRALDERARSLSCATVSLGMEPRAIGKGGLGTIGRAGPSQHVNIVANS